MGKLRVEGVVARSVRAHALVQPVESIEAAIMAAAGIYGTAPTSHLGLAARVEGYAPADLEQARLESRTIMRVPGMRGSVFLAPLGLASAFLGLSRSRTARQTLAGAGITQAELEHVIGRIDMALSDGSLGAREIRTRLGDDDPGGPITTLTLRTMAHEGRIVAAEPVGGTSATAYRYARMADWAPALEPMPTVEGALAVMAPIWMRANGPGTIGDLAWWAGVTKARARKAVEEMGARTVEVEGLAEEQWATDAVIDEALAVDPSPAVRLLPVWDAWLMARRERSRILEPAHRPYVVDRSGNVTNTITRGGEIIGTWDVQDDVLLVHRFADVPLASIASAAVRLGSVFAWTSVQEILDPPPLDDGGQNAFRSPLRRAG